MAISVIQFMHNGREHKPDYEKGKSWNRGDHGRKFLRCSGAYIDQNESKIQGPIMFWGEWEPESRVLRRIEKPTENGPHYVYEPYYVCPSSFKGLQNTDPFVFGKTFRYSICQQPHLPSLRNLEKGSLILFGSCVMKKFALDTVFVVSDSDSYRRDKADTIPQVVDETYRIVTINAILEGKGSGFGKSCTREIDSTIYKLYRGAMFNNRAHNGMFSFFPCQAYTEDSNGFARPMIQMPTITDTLVRGVRITKCKDLDEVISQWKEVVKQVTRTCCFGVFAEMPPMYESECTGTRRM